MIPPRGRTAKPMPSVAKEGFRADRAPRVAADDPAEGTHREADAERREGEQRARQRVAGREERVTEVEGRGRAEADEVVGLDRRADRAADRHLLLAGAA